MKKKTAKPTKPKAVVLPYLEQFQWQYRHLTGASRAGQKARWIQEPVIYDKLDVAVNDAIVYSSCRANDCGGHRLMRIISVGADKLAHPFLYVIAQKP